MNKAERFIIEKLLPALDSSARESIVEYDPEKMKELCRSVSLVEQSEQEIDDIVKKGIEINTVRDAYQASTFKDIKAWIEFHQREWSDKATVEEGE